MISLKTHGGSQTHKNILLVLCGDHLDNILKNILHHGGVCGGSFRVHLIWFHSWIQKVIVWLKVERIVVSFLVFLCRSAMSSFFRREKIKPIKQGIFHIPDISTSVISFLLSKRNPTVRVWLRVFVCPSRLNQHWWSNWEINIQPVVKQTGFSRFPKIYLCFPPAGAQFTFSFQLFTVQSQPRQTSISQTFFSAFEQGPLSARFGCLVPCQLPSVCLSFCLCSSGVGTVGQLGILLAMLGSWTVNKSLTTHSAVFSPTLCGTCLFINIS